MVGIKPLIVAFVLTGLFALAIINAGLLIAEYNNPAQSIGNDASLISYRDNLQDKLADSYEDSNNSLEAFSQSPISLGGTSVFIDAIGGVWKTMVSVPITIFNLTFGLVAERITGTEVMLVVLGTISALLIMYIIFSVWRLFQTGESD